MGTTSRRTGRRWALVLVTALVLLAVPASRALANHVPAPVGDPGGTGTMRGTAVVAQRTYGAPACLPEGRPDPPAPPRGRWPGWALRRSERALRRPGWPGRGPGEGGAWGGGDVATGATPPASNRPDLIV